MNADQATQKAVSTYFKDPTSTAKDAGTSVAGTGDNLLVQRRDLSKLKEKIEALMKTMPELSDNMRKQIQMTVTGEGLRIDLMETEKGLFFEAGNAQPTDSGRGLLTALSVELQKMPNNIFVEGHTDATPYSGAGNYTNWELSADRANAARRTLQAAGLPASRISQVRGFADQRLHLPEEPHNASNRRVSLVVEYLNGAVKPEGGETSARSGSGSESQPHAQASPARPPHAS
jgi:chemotaxis protein MotB